MTHFQKKAAEENDIHPKFQETKQTFIEFKVVRKNKHRLSERNEAKEAEIKSNLQKKYERSTITRDFSRNTGRYMDGFDEACLKRKLKTEKSSLKEESIKNLLNFSEDPEK
jgi:hypothetical protein